LWKITLPKEGKTFLNKLFLLEKGLTKGKPKKNQKGRGWSPKGTKASLFFYYTKHRGRIIFLSFPGFPPKGFLGIPLGEMAKESSHFFPLLRGFSRSKNHFKSLFPPLVLGRNFFGEKILPGKRGALTNSTGVLGSQP